MNLNTSLKFLAFKIDGQYVHCAASFYIVSGKKLLVLRDDLERVIAFVKD